MQVFTFPKVSCALFVPLTGFYLLFDRLNRIVLHRILEAFHVIGPLLGFQQVDLASFNEGRQVPFHGDHPFIRLVLGFDLHLGIHLLDLSLSDQVGQGVVAVEDFHCDHSAGPFLAWDQFLADNIPQSQRQLVSHFVLSLGREEIQYPCNAADHIARVQC